MKESLLDLLRCPVSRSVLQLQVISTGTKMYDGVNHEIIGSGILFADKDWFYPVIDGIPRLNVESFLDYEDFLRQHLPDYISRKQYLLEKYGSFINYIIQKNRKTKKSFAFEWSLFNYEKDKTWDADSEGMLQRFLQETAETESSLRDKLIFDAGCGNGKLNELIAEKNTTILGMDFSTSIERAYQRNTRSGALFIQGDVQFPPVAFEKFDIVHCSGVLIATNNTELSFSCIEPCVKKGGKLSVWLYHPRKDFIHNSFNFLRRFTSKLPLRVQYYLYLFTLFPVSYIVKRLKGNPENSREMMINILDWFSPEFRWEHSHTEAAAWYYKRDYDNVQVTTTSIFGFNITGVKK